MKPATLNPSMVDVERHAIPVLENGDRLTRVEFERRYQSMPELKKAEFIEGIVYMSSPVRARQHGQPHLQLATWLGTYQASTPFVFAADNATVRLDLDNEPQPDLMLCIEAEAGGQSTIDEDGYITGAPELVVEIAASSASYDLHDKLKAYRRNGVKEYIIWQTRDRKIDWLVFSEGQYYSLASEKGVYKSPGFPGLVLDALALLEGNLANVLEILQQGISSNDHQAFVQALSEKAAE
jgi:Uma2 family endonuclease